MKITCLTLISLMFFSCQNSTRRIDESFQPVEKQIVSPPIVNDKYAYVAIVFEVPKVERVESSRGPDDYLVYPTYCKVYYERKLMKTEITTLSDFKEDDEYRLMDYTINRFNNEYGSNFNFINVELMNCPDKELYKDAKTKLIKKKSFIFDSYKSASIHRENNEGKW